MAYTASTPRLGIVDLTNVVAVAPAIGQPGVATLPSVTTEPQFGEIVTGWDANLGAGEFMFVKAAAGITAGDVVELAFTLVSGVMTVTATGWTGTTITGKPLAVALVTLTTGQSGWVQVQGNAITKTTGSPVSGNPVYYGAATATVRPTANAGAQMLNAVYSTAPSVVIGQGSSAVTLTSTQAVVFLDRPFSQGAIT